MPHYNRPSKKIHRGFRYLNDETVINSLSAVESGKIDEVVAKVNSAREGGFGGGAGLQGVKLEGSRKLTAALEEEMVRTRTRFSIFGIWYQNLIESKALGTFTGWGSTALADVQPGDTVEFRASLEVAPIQTLLRLYLWFADKAKTGGNMFSQEGAQLKETRKAETNIRMILGGDDQGFAEQVVYAWPNGEPGPLVATPVLEPWLIGSIGSLAGEYTVVAQVERIINEGDAIPALRLTNVVAPTPLEASTMKQVVSSFVEPAKALGVEISETEASIAGPALWVEPIAIYR